MTFVSHAYVGAVSYVALSRVIGVEHAGVAIPLVGAMLGSAPDTVDWVGAKMGCWPRWWLYNILHFSRLAVIAECILVAPGEHVLLDRLVHNPFGVQPSIPDMGRYIYAEIVMDFAFTILLLATWR